VEEDGQPSSEPPAGGYGAATVELADQVDEAVLFVAASAKDPKDRPFPLELGRLFAAAL
jgi:hypothetical protein